ncbi:MAG: shikimate dehydrogenase, partial [Acidimicrobiales bacterium]|nr:shikimate dehydrogenase [Acidimicrobiales bacterium]
RRRQAARRQPVAMRISGTTRIAGVIGDPVRHSLSPVIHNAAFAEAGLDWAFVAFEVCEGDAAAAITGARALGVDGLSVTMPHKGAVIEALDRLSPTATRLGAVNAIVREGTEFVGHSTDGPGLVDALAYDEGFAPEGKRCVVVGAGGAARAVVLALADAGADEVVVINRTHANAELAAALAGRNGRVGTASDVRDADLVVNATPLGMTGGAELPAVDPSLFHSNQLVVDLVYAPPVTPTIQAARAAGAHAVGGLGMLVHQAAHAFTLWTGQEAPLPAMSAAAMAALAHSHR